MELRSRFTMILGVSKGRETTSFKNEHFDGVLKRLFAKTFHSLFLAETVYLPAL